MFLILALLAACGNPVTNCDNGSDCCSTDEQCAKFYGTVAPYCTTNPGPAGLCGECRTDDDCDALYHGDRPYCTDDATIGAYCDDTPPS